ncbi:RNA-binding protein 4-like [Scleropages formosus]|uniref:RNA-binding protein 4-like n=1 Tax=Scleropages formosus TaxID=113540 RepID=A0A0P7UXK9_SCLFO|nr:RNA-binding protein 4-like [Scleropages formosus]
MRQRRTPVFPVKMVKIFVGNLPRETETDEIQALFSQYGAVTECSIIKNYAFVHMEDRKCATKAIRNLHLYKLHGTPINVEASHGKNPGPVKLHVANVEKGCDDDLRALFEEYGTVNECSVIKNFAFVHMANYEEAMDAIKGLDNADFQGKRIHVQISKSRPRGDEEEEFQQHPPENAGYWGPGFPGDRPEPGPPGYFRGRRPPFSERSASFERDRNSYGVVDYYEKYRARPYGITSFEERRVASIPPPPPPPIRERLPTPAPNPYERRPLPPPSSTYFNRDRSPIRRAPPNPTTPAGNGCSYERSRLSPLSMSRNPMYGMPRAREPYAERVPPPPPARYTY